MKRWIRGLLVVSVLVAVALISLPGRGQGNEVRELGVAPMGQSAIQFMGKATVDYFVVKRFGYLTRLNGLRDGDQYFSRDDPNGGNEGTARFTQVEIAKAIMAELYEPALAPRP